MRPEDGNVIVEWLEEWYLTHEKPPHGLLTVLRRNGLELVEPEDDEWTYECGAMMDAQLLDEAMYDREDLGPIELEGHDQSTDWNDYSQDGYREWAKAVNARRAEPLTDEQLQAFCDFWTDGGKVTWAMYPGAMAKRLDLWARNGGAS